MIMTTSQLNTFSHSIYTLLILIYSANITSANKYSISYTTTSIAISSCICRQSTQTHNQVGNFVHYILLRVSLFVMLAISFITLASISCLSDFLYFICKGRRSSICDLMFLMGWWFSCLNCHMAIIGRFHYIVGMVWALFLLSILLMVMGIIRSGCSFFFALRYLQSRTLVILLFVAFIMFLFIFFNIEGPICVMISFSNKKIVGLALSPRKVFLIFFISPLTFFETMSYAFFQVYDIRRVSFFFYNL